ncbi:MAG: gamma-glutamyl hercynylcysteine S-oxide hydrolase [Actinomycetota bacterium]|jgi:glutamine amidotransferase|nr:gamma-glutamyl hercynylcysteine S-oxide hydrolase [Actinomycetota bacterium]
MCRLLGYLGPPTTLQALLYDPSHSLHEQSWAPRDQRSGVVNADGVGVGWYDLDRRPEPARYRSAKPMWADQSLASLAGVVTSGAVLAVVRGATAPSPAEESSTPPFTEGVWLFAHNGRVDGFRTGAGTRLRRGVSEQRDAGIVGTSDSEVLFALFLDRLDKGMAPAEALASVVDAVDAEEGGSVTMIATDGHRLAAVTAGDSLAVLSTEGAVVVASEPYDDDSRWNPVPDASLVEAVPGNVTYTGLDRKERA